MRPVIITKQYLSLKLHQAPLTERELDLDVTKDVVLFLYIGTSIIRL